MINERKDSKIYNASALLIVMESAPHGYEERSP